MTHAVNLAPTAHRMERSPASDPDAARALTARIAMWLRPGVHGFRQLNFLLKTALFAVVLVLPLCGLIGYGLWASSEQALQARMDATRQHVEIAHGILGWAHEQQRSGKLDEEQAQTAAREAVATLRYDELEYFWINDLQLRMVMHPFKPELDGQPLGAITDSNGVALFREFARTAREKGSGFISYKWPRPGSDAPVEKLSYVQGFKPWGWVIGSGIYVDDLATAQAQQLQLVLWVALLTALVSGYGFLSYYRAMQSSLEEVSYHLRQITAGKLDLLIQPRGRDEASRLMLDLHEMQEFLCQMVQRIRGTSEDIDHSSSEIASGANDLSRRTRQAADSLETSAASMEEITATVANTTRNTEEASRMARHNSEVAATGGQSMREVADTMQGIQASSSRIGEIIGTINGIAFQTNLLALNAAVEAARAGEAGRGFAVVATEVRTLAQRSADAAHEIKQLVGNSVQQVDAGSAVVQRACAIIEEIVESSRQVDRLLDDVSSAAREQSIGVDQIGRSVSDLDRMTQQNGALVCETVAAAATMKGQAGTLISEVARFRLPAAAACSHTFVEAAAVDFDFDGAIEAHRQWKVKLRKAIAGKEVLDAETLRRDDQCALGKWIHGQGADRWSGKPVFQDLTSQHARFHQAAGDVARLINDGQYDDAERLIGSGSRFAEVSTQVSTLLTQAREAL